jgi:hypothetical protein
MAFQADQITAISARVTTMKAIMMKTPAEKTKQSRAPAAETTVMMHELDYEDRRRGEVAWLLAVASPASL